MFSNPFIARKISTSTPSVSEFISSILCKKIIPVFNTPNQSNYIFVCIYKGNLICFIYSDKKYSPKYGKSCFLFQYHCPTIVVPAQSYWSRYNIFTRKSLLKILSAFKIKIRLLQLFKKLPLKTNYFLENK